MRPINFVVPLLAAIAVAGTTGAVYALRSQRAPGKPLAAAPTAEETRDAPFASGPDPMVTALDQRLAALERRSSEARPAEGDAAPATATPPRLPPARAVPSPAELSALVDTQPRDSQWANAYEHAIVSSYASSFHDDRVREAKCAESVCRVVVEHTSPANAMAFEARFWTALPEGYEGAHFEPQTSADGTQTTVLHVLRRGFMEGVEN